MIKLNLKKMIEEDYKGKKLGRKILTKDGYLTNGIIAVKKGFNETIDKIFEGNDVEEGRFGMYETNPERCEYKVVDVEEKVTYTKLTGVYECLDQKFTGSIYIYSAYYRFMKKNNLEIKIHPSSHMFIAIDADAELQMMGLGIRMHDEKTFLEDTTIEEYLAEKEEEKARKEKAKKLMEDHAMKVAKEEVIRLRTKSDVIDIIAGKEYRISKYGKKYVLETYMDFEDGKGFRWCTFFNLGNLASQLTEQKMIGEKIIELLATELEGLDAEIKEKEKELEINKANMVELDKIQEELVKFGAVHPAFKVGVYGSDENGYRLEVQGLGHFLRLKVGYTLENVLRSMDGYKELFEGTKEEIVEKIKEIIKPEVEEYNKYLERIEKVKMFMQNESAVVGVTKHGMYEVIDLNTGRINEVNRGKLKSKTHYGSLAEYVADHWNSIAPIDLKNEGLTKKELNEKLMVEIDLLTVYKKIEEEEEVVDMEKIKLQDVQVGDVIQHPVDKEKECLVKYIEVKDGQVHLRTVINNIGYASDTVVMSYNEGQDKEFILISKAPEKEIKISIEGEGRVEEIVTNNLEDANRNLRRRIKEVVDGIAYCNKTWITIDVKEFTKPIEFRVDLINRLHGNIDNVLELIIKEKRMEIEYMKNNIEKCTWVKDKDKFFEYREEVIKVLEGYLPEPDPTPEQTKKEIKILEHELEELPADATADDYLELAEKINNKKEVAKNTKEIIIKNNTDNEHITTLMQDVIKKTRNKEVFGDRVEIIDYDADRIYFEGDNISLRLWSTWQIKNKNNINLHFSWELFKMVKDPTGSHGEEVTSGKTKVIIPIEPEPEKIKLELRKIEEPAKPIRGDYVDCKECGSENFVKTGKNKFICQECGEENIINEEYEIARDDE